MTRDEDAQALAELRRRDDLSEVPVDLLLRTAKLARQDHQHLKTFTGRAAAQLNRAGMTWEKIGQALDMAPMTIYRWAQPFL